MGEPQPPKITSSRRGANLAEVVPKPTVPTRLDPAQAPTWQSCVLPGPPGPSPLTPGVGRKRGLGGGVAGTRPARGPRPCCALGARAPGPTAPPRPERGPGKGSARSRGATASSGRRGPSLRARPPPPTTPQTYF